MGRPVRIVAFAVPLACWLAGCTPGAGQSPPDAPPPATEPREAPMDAALSSVTEAVLADAAARTGEPRASLELVSAAAVTWADGSLGCPAPGMSYTMALVPGYRVQVRAGGQVLDYHASRRGYFVLCPAGRAVDPAGDAVM